MYFLYVEMPNSHLVSDDYRAAPYEDKLLLAVKDVY